MLNALRRVLEADLDVVYALLFGSRARRAERLDSDADIAHDLAPRLAAAAAFRNLVAHQYGALDWRRVYAIAASDPGDLDAFCATLADQALS